MRKIAVDRSLISSLVQELQSFEDTKIKAKSGGHETRKSIKLIKINQN